MFETISFHSFISVYNSQPTYMRASSESLGVSPILLKQFSDGGNTVVLSPVWILGPISLKQFSILINHLLRNRRTNKKYVIAFLCTHNKLNMILYLEN